MSQESSDFSWHPSQTDGSDQDDSDYSDDFEFAFESDSDDDSNEFDMLDTMFENDPVDDVNVNNVSWTNDFVPVYMEEIVAASGPCHSLNVATANERDFLHLYLSPGTISKICTETNRFAATFNDRCWYETTVQELEAFLGLCIMMGIVRLPCYKLYWSQNSFLQNQGFINVMPCARFAKILQYLHINDEVNDVDPLVKVRPLLTDTLANIKQNYAPNKHLSLDEGIVGFKGRHTAVQYIPSKPVKRGFKIWMLCDSRSGFCHNFKVYMGRLVEGDGGPQGLGFKITKELTSELAGKNHQVFFDSWFTSIPLLISLKEDGIYSCGTVRSNRKGLPSEFRTLPKLQQGESRAYQSGQLSAYVWQDKRPVTLLSTTSDPTEDVPALRRQADGSRTRVSRPAALALYQDHFRGVDKCDQLRAAYPVGRASRKWWRYIFHFVVNITVINAFITVKESALHGQEWAKKRFSQLDFRMNLAQQLIYGFQHKGRSRTGVLPICNTTLHEHRWVRLQRKKSTCKWCRAKRGLRKETVYACISCNQHFCSLAHHSAYHDVGSQLHHVMEQ